MTELVRAAIENESKLQDACLLEDKDFFIDDVSILGKTFAVIFTIKKIIYACGNDWVALKYLLIGKIKRMWKWIVKFLCESTY